jgi:hypothetical protein
MNHPDLAKLDVGETLKLRTYWSTAVGSRAFLRKEMRIMRQLPKLAFRLPEKLLLLENLSLKASLWRSVY